MRVCAVVITVFSILLIAAAFPTNPNNVRAQTTATQAAAKPPKVQALLDSQNAAGEVSVFAVLDGNSFNYYGSGPVTKDNKLRYGSLTKMFTGYIGLRKGISPEDKLFKYGIVDCQYPGASLLTMKQVGGHQSGISEYARESSPGKPGVYSVVNDTLVWAFGGNFTVLRDVNLGWEHQQLDFAPGTQYCYSNTNCELLGLAVERHTGNSVQYYMDEYFNGLHYDDGSTPACDYPNTDVYQNWPYPATMPGVSGTMIGTPRAALKGFKKIVNSQYFSTMTTWMPSRPECTSYPGVVAGDKYGFFMQNYNTSKITGGAIGHDGNLIVRSFLVRLTTGELVLYHTSEPIDNDTLLARSNAVIASYRYWH